MICSCFKTRDNKIMNELLPHMLGERATFHEGISKPHTASTTTSRGQAADR